MKAWMRLNIGACLMTLGVALLAIFVKMPPDTSIWVEDLLLTGFLVLFFFGLLLFRGKKDE